MAEMSIDQNEDGNLTYEISDEELEAAVHGVSEEAGSYTLAFCTALTDCPGP